MHVTAAEHNCLSALTCRTRLPLACFGVQVVSALCCAQMARGTVQLNGSLASMGMWALAVSQDFGSPLYRTLTASLAQFHHSSLDTAALQRIHHVRPNRLRSGCCHASRLHPAHLTWQSVAQPRSACLTTADAAPAVPSIITSML